MYVTPLTYTYGDDEIQAGKNILQFGRGPEQFVWELNAKKVYVYKLYNVVQVVGDWYEKGSSRKITGVLNLKFRDEDMYQARFGDLTASEITALPWEDWFIYRIDKERKNGKDSFNYNEAR